MAARQTTIFAALWGLCGWLFYAPVIDFEQVALIMSITGMIGGMVAVTAPIPAVHRPYALLSGLPLMVQWLLEFDVSHFILVLMGSIFISVLIMAARKTALHFREMVHVQFQKNELARSFNHARLTAEAANRAKTQFISNVSHEVRTPMNAIMGLSQVLEQSHLNSRQHHMIKRILDAGEELLSILDSVLDFSELESGLVELEMQEFDPVTLVREIVSQEALKKHNKDLEVCVDVASYMPQRVVGDQRRFGQVIANLFGNAIKYTKEGSIDISVTCDSSPPQDDDADGVVFNFTIRDTGIGIEKGTLQKIFDAFEQEDGSLTRSYGGIGLGLTIVGYIVHLMNGSIGIDSAVGKGTTVEVSIPFQLARANQAVPKVA